MAHHKISGEYYNASLNGEGFCVTIGKSNNEFEIEIFSWSWGCSSVVEILPTRHEALALILNTTENKNKTKQKKHLQLKH
jgi:hypothetical protein